MDKRLAFLYAAVTDLQNTIRTVDSKTNYLAIVLTIPMLKLGAIEMKCATLYKLAFPYSHVVVSMLVVTFSVSWICAICSAYKALSAINNPQNHIAGDHPVGTFYPNNLFQTSIIDVFFNRSIQSVRQFHVHRDDLPSTEEEIFDSIAFEQMKLVYIRDMKLLRVRYAYGSSCVWVVSGGLIWMASFIV